MTELSAGSVHSVGRYAVRQRLPIQSAIPQPVRHADRTQYRSQYAGPLRFTPDPEGVQRYVDEVVRGKASALDFVLYVPPGHGSLAGSKLPNVEETSEPARLFTAAFRGGKEMWPAPERDR